MARAVFGIAGVLVIAALVGLSFAPTVSATRYDIDITKTVQGYTIHIVGWIDVDPAAKTITGQIRVTVTDPSGVVIFDKTFDFTYTWSSTPPRIMFVVPGARLLVTISFGPSGIAVTSLPLFNPQSLRGERARLERVR